MNIVLVLCPSWGIETPHLGIALLSANLRKHGYDVGILDFNIRIHNKDKEKCLWKSEEDVYWEDEASLSQFIKNNDEILDLFVEEILSTNARVIGFSVYNTTKRISLELAKRIKEKDKDRIIVCGGQMCFPEPTAESIVREEYVDAVVMGEGDQLIVNLLEDIKKSGKITSSCLGVLCKNKGEIVSSGIAPPIIDINNLPYPDFSDFDLKMYGNPKQLPMLSSRGCPYPCVFCNTKLFWIKYRSMTGDRIFNEILYQINKYKDVSFITFNDHCVNANIAALSRFADLATGLKKRGGISKINNYAEFGWRGAAVIRDEMDKDFIKKLKLSGCIELEFGIESAANRVRRLMKKPPDDIKVIERVIRDTTEAGIGVRANFMFGFPGETEEDFEENLEFLKRNKDYFVQVHPSETFCHIDPNTYMYNHPEEFDIKDYKDNSLYWESRNGKNIYLVRLRRHQIFCELANSLKIPLSPGGHKILLHKQHFIDDYNRYIEKKQQKEPIEKGNVVISDGDKYRLSDQSKIQEIKQPNSLMFDWFIHYKCNYRCPYCDFYENRIKWKMDNKYFSVEEWIKAWKMVCKLYGRCNIHIHGGEPFTYPYFGEIIKELVLLHEVTITTSLSTDIDSFLDTINNGHVKIIPVFHPAFVNLEGFIDKVNTLKEKGFSDAISYVAYPPQINQIPFYKKRFVHENIKFSIIPFNGNYNGIKYPEGYSNEEKAILDSYSNGCASDIKKKIYDAGRYNALIKPDGTVIRCDVAGVNDIMGSFFNGNFKL